MPVHFGHSCNICLAAAMHAVATSDGFTGIRHTSGMFENNTVLRHPATEANVFFVIVHISLGTILICKRHIFNSIQFFNQSNQPSWESWQAKYNIAIYT